MSLSSTVKQRAPQKQSPLADSRALVVTLGDPAGIGPEVIEKALEVFRAEHPQVPVQILGSTRGVKPGRPSLRGARMALEALHSSADQARAGSVRAIINGPVHKGGLIKLGFTFPGQTEFYARNFGLPADAVSMLMTAPRLTVGLVTTHCSLRSAIRKLSLERVVSTAVRLNDFLRLRGIRSPRLALAALNPHAGEEGAFGNEEETLLKPALQQMKRQALSVSGPVPADSVFMAARNGKFDGVIALYHDQGLIPFKLLCFDTGVNVTAGLPVWRMSPDHGTAFDIAGTGQADASSMLEAFRLAVHLTESSPDQ
ncbi:MAG: 4-hydroxythreonine-4-phosphate dehydrogenase PdxA [Candidatus Methylacidiphilales bacterium]